MEITIAQGLQLKNELATRVGILTRRVKENNQRETVEGSKAHFDYDVKEVLIELQETTKKLIDLKVKLDLASIAKREDIYKISEIKSTITMYKSMPSTQGIVSNYNGSKLYVVAMNKVEIDSNIDVLQQELNKLLNDINHFNNSTVITLS